MTENIDKVLTGELTMIKNQLRIGSITKQGTVVSFYEHGIHVRYGKCIPYTEVEPEPLTEEWLRKFGFTFDAKQSSAYINGGRWYLRAGDGFCGHSSMYLHSCGMSSFKKDGQMGVKLLGTRNIGRKTFTTVHEVQNLFHAITGIELTTKEMK